MGRDSDGISEDEKCIEGGRQSVYKDRSFGIGGFLFLLALLVLLYSKASYDFDTAPTVVLSWFPRWKLRTVCSDYDITLLLPTLAIFNPAHYTRCKLRIFWDTLTDECTNMVAPCTCLVNRYVSCVVSKVMLSRLTSCNIFWLYTEWKSLKEQMRSPTKPSEKSSMCGSIWYSSPFNHFALMAEMMKQYYPLFFGTQMWAFLSGPQGGSHRPHWMMSSFIYCSTAMTLFSMCSTWSVQNRWPVFSKIQSGGSTSSLIMPSSSHVNGRAYTILDSIPRVASFSFGHNMPPICNSHSLSRVNLPPLCLQGNVAKTAYPNGQVLGLPGW